MVEHLPKIFERGTKKSGPKAIPATAADIYPECGQRSMADVYEFNDKESTEYDISTGVL